jgi:glycosyltransferase involved in cell wall biosynthesis
MRVAGADSGDVKVSVAMITYNQERFIAQAIESVLVQETDFGVELVIGEDCSTDGTRAIARDYGEWYPGRIRLLLRDRNLGMIPNFVATLGACGGQYVALCEGDDYWTDPGKLQKQVDFLDAHPEYAVCFHDVAVVDDQGRERSATYCPADQKRRSTLEDVLRSDFLPTCSVMYRRGLFGEFPPWYEGMPTGDWPLHVLNAEHGDIGYLPEVMGVYRQHGGGVYTSLSYDRRFQDMLRIYDVFGAHLEQRYEGIIEEARCSHMAELVVEKAKATGSFGEGVAVARSTLDEWQGAYGLPNAWRRKALGRVYAYYLFASRAGEVDRSTARHCFGRMFCYDPSWLRNAGVWSIAADAFLGTTISHSLRRVTGGRWLQAQGREAR